MPRTCAHCRLLLCVSANKKASPIKNQGHKVIAKSYLSAADFITFIRFLFLKNSTVKSVQNDTERYMAVIIFKVVFLTLQFYPNLDFTELFIITFFYYIL